MSAILLSLCVLISSIAHAGPTSSRVSESDWADQVLNVHACFEKAFQEGKAQQAAGVDIDTMDAFIAKSCQKEIIDADNLGAVSAMDMARLLYNVQQQ